jgi:hypothetical protein
MQTPLSLTQKLVLSHLVVAWLAFFVGRGTVSSEVSVVAETAAKPVDNPVESPAFDFDVELAKACEPDQRLDGYSPRIQNIIEQLRYEASHPIITWTIDLESRYFDGNTEYADISHAYGVTYDDFRRLSAMYYEMSHAPSTEIFHIRDKYTHIASKTMWTEQLIYAANISSQVEISKLAAYFKYQYDVAIAYRDAFKPPFTLRLPVIDTTLNELEAEIGVSFNVAH